MAKQPEEKTAQPAGAAKVGNGAQPSLNVLAQYVKDLSFESPGAPNSLRARDKAPGSTSPIRPAMAGSRR